jgi:acyl-CoA synthetase (AMP-forming)/AMP-acid ligase II/peptidoglycan/LPS O-acetylase OafA/YrhL
MQILDEETVFPASSHRFFFNEIERGGSGIALISSETTLTWTELANRADAFVRDVKARLPAGVERPLVLLETANEIEPIVAYVGMQRTGWPVILTAQDSGTTAQSVIETFLPNVIVRPSCNGWTADVSPVPPVEMHPDLAVLLSTSGTTGAAKLVRLSRQNLQTNAAAIIEYLSLTVEDRAITTLPFNYSYGMSVLHTQLMVGAPLILTDASVVDPSFWALARAERATSLALVPTQFEMLEADGWTRDRIPDLRYITQAGGKLDPLIARKMAERADAEGWKLFIMYGQTEAGPRMSYVPPEDVREWAHSIGRPIPGGAFRLIDESGDNITAIGVTGELVFTGPGVMQGYALTRAELSAPAGSQDLKTGDLAERLENGSFRITGRASRFLKLFGLRIGLDEVETTLRREGTRVFASGSDTQGLVLFLHGGTADEATDIARSTAKRYKLPDSVVRAVPIEAPPLLSSGKTDYRSLARMAESLPPAEDQATDLATILKQVLRRPSLDLDKTFLESGGDSLAYLSVQLHLSDRLGQVPAGWETQPLRELLRLTAQGRSRRADTAMRLAWQPVSADLLGRVVAVHAVIALHSTSWPVGGGAYLLFLLSGVSLARFQTASLLRGDIVRTLQSMLLPIVVCYYIVLIGSTLLWKPVGFLWFLLLGNLSQAENFDGLTPYWFVCTYAQANILLVLPFLVPQVRHFVARKPIAAVLSALLVVAVLVEVTAVNDIPFNTRHRHPLGAMELMLLGWLAALTKGWRENAAASVGVLGIVALHWFDVAPSVAIILLGGGLATLWGVQVPMPVAAARAVMRIGSLTLFIYIAHMPMFLLARTLLPDLGEGWRYLVLAISCIAAAAVFEAAFNKGSQVVGSAFTKMLEAVRLRSQNA